MRNWYAGTARHIVFSGEADVTLAAALAEVGAHKIAAAAAQLNARLQHVGDTGRVSSHILRHEGDKVYGVKTTQGVRGYGWFGQFERRESFIIHFFTKKSWQKMRAQDRERVVDARKAYDEKQLLESKKNTSQKE